MSQFFISGGQSIEVSALGSVFSMNIQDSFSLWLTGSPYSPRDSQESSPTPQFTSINSSALSFLHGPTLTAIHYYWKNHSFDKTELCWQSNVSVFNMLSRLVITFLPRIKCPLISWLQSPSAMVLEPQKIKSINCFHCFPSICHEVMGPDAMILVFWMLSFKPIFTLSSFTLIKSLFSCSLLSVIRVVSSVYLRLMIFLLEILIPACASSTLTFYMMYYPYKLNKLGENVQPWHTPFPNKNQSVVPCLVLLLTCI